MSPPISHHPLVYISEQPSKGVRYRYPCEKRNGKTTNISETKIACAIAVVGYSGKVLILVSCVTKDAPYKAHPHSLVGPNCTKGFCCVETEITPENSIVRFPKLAIQCIKRNEMQEALAVREAKNIDPFSTGFSHKNNVKEIDLHTVRLCFQVFLKQNNKSKIPLTPVVTNEIINTKAFSDPLIYRLSHCNSFVNGREDDIILLCTKFAKNDIKVRFYELLNDEVIWEDFATFHSNNVYNNSAICMRPPPYYDQHITEPIRVLVQLIRLSDDAVSPSVEFEYLPLAAAPGALKIKRQKNDTFTEFVQNTMSQTFIQYNFPNIINDLNQPSCSNLEDTPDVLENPNNIRRIFNLNTDQMELEPLHLSSGDLDMTDLNRLSGNLQENLVL